MDVLRFRTEIRWLYQAALLLFLVTIGLGMARGLGIIDFTDRNQPLTHLHSGTIGWITLGALAAALWLYGGTTPREPGDRYVTWTSVLLVVAVPLYIAAWWTGNLPFRAVGGASVLVGIVLFAWWLVREAGRIGYGRLSTPRLGVVVGLVALVVGSTLGVALQVQFATGAFVLPGEPAGAHAELQVSAYLVLVGMSLVYWRLLGDERTRRGTWMVWLFVAGGVLNAIALLANVLPLTILYIPLDLAAFALLLSLGWRRIVAPGWSVGGAARHYAIAVPFALAFFAIFIFLLVGFAFLGFWKDISEIPPNIIPAGEHPLFVGMATNIAFGLLIDLTRDRRRWPWADHVVFWGVNLAVAVFTIVLLANATGLFPIVTPILGLSILLGIVVNTAALWSEPRPRQAMAATTLA